MNFRDLDNELEKDSTKARAIFKRLEGMFNAHKEAAKDLIIQIQDNDWRSQVVREISLNSGSITIRYGGGKRGGYATELGGEDIHTVRVSSSVIQGYDADGEGFKIIGARGVGSADKPTRSITKTCAGGLKVGDDEVGVSVIPHHISRAVCFRAASLEKGTENHGKWGIKCSLLEAGSDQPRLWGDHRCIMEYLGAEAKKTGRSIKVPTQKIMNSMGMRLTKNSLVYGKEALKRLKTTKVWIKTAEGRKQEISFIDDYSWNEDGSVDVVVSSSYLSNFKVPGSKAIYEAITGIGEENLIPWLACFAVDGEKVIVSKSDLEALAFENDSYGEYVQDSSWDQLTKFNSAEPKKYLYAIWHDQKFVNAIASLDQIGNQFYRRVKVLSDDQLLENARVETDRMKEVFKSGGFVTDRFHRVAWRNNSPESIEIVAFEGSGLEKQKIGRY
jgi:hypothetical protein